MPSSCCTDSASVRPSLIRGDDRAALDEARLVDGVVVARHVLILGRLDHLDIGDVADEHSEQRSEQEKMTLKQKFEPYVPVK